MTKNQFITINPAQTRKLGRLLAKELCGGEIICLTGELGSGKTTFAQGVLKGLGAKGLYTSPTFLVIKHYKKKILNPKHQIPSKSQNSSPNFFQSPAFPLRQTSCRNSSKPSFIQNIYHIDAYRVGPKDILDLGWREIISDECNIVIVEWVEKIKRIVPKNAVWIKFRHIGREKREIIVS